MTDVVIVDVVSDNIAVVVQEQPVQVVSVATTGPQGPRGDEGFIALEGNTPVPPGTPAGTIILRY